MAQEHVWEKEYRNPQFVTKFDKPQPFILALAKYIRKQKKWKWDEVRVLDLGSGTGRNSVYFAQKGAHVTGIEISPSAVHFAKLLASKNNLDISYRIGSFGKTFDGILDEKVDLVLDVTSSNSLDEQEREVYLHEVSRVLSKDGLFFVRGLLKDGDQNAKVLLQEYPGSEKDTYVMPSVGLQERVFSQEDFYALYKKYFSIIKFEKTQSYMSVGGKTFKRRFFIAYLELL
ncbi:class I SAM-dependent methyltransferase [Candidatus Nomurabacteria bacterium]|nr:class I SAM-dependent methyltransferase [Candidatus Nomurabacteria bacterium]